VIVAEYEWVGAVAAIMIAALRPAIVIVIVPRMQVNTIDQG
jgi:hypothetical protein